MKPRYRYDWKLEDWVRVVKPGEIEVMSYGAPRITAGQIESMKSARLTMVDFPGWLATTPRA